MYHHYHHQTWHVLESFVWSCRCFPKRKYFCMYKVLGWEFRSLSWILRCKAVIWCEAGNGTCNFSFSFWSLCHPPLLPLGCYACLLYRQNFCTLRIVSNLLAVPMVIIWFMYLCITGTLILWIQLRIQCASARKINLRFGFFFFLCMLFFPLPLGVLAKADITKSCCHTLAWRAWVKMCRLVTQNCQHCCKRRSTPGSGAKAIDHTDAFKLKALIFCFKILLIFHAFCVCAHICQLGYVNLIL